jgi:hypothetical protein
VESRPLEAETIKTLEKVAKNFQFGDSLSSNNTISFTQRARTTDGTIWRNINGSDAKLGNDFGCSFTPFDLDNEEVQCNIHYVVNGKAFPLEDDPSFALFSSYASDFLFKELKLVDTCFAYGFVKS